MNKLIRVSSWVGVFLVIGAFACMVAFNVIGQEIDAQGILHEPFFLIPLFWLCVMLSLIAGGVNLFARIMMAKEKKRANDQIKQDI